MKWTSSLLSSKVTKIILWCGYIFSLCINLGKPPLIVEEPRRALITLEMQFNKNLLVPTQMGEFYYKKPPLFNWLMMITNKIWGENELASRSITVISLLLICLMIYRFTKPYLGTRIAEYAALFYGISGNIYFSFSVLGEIDLFYAMLTFPMLIWPYSLMEKQKYGAVFLVIYLLGLAGFLTKGFTSPIFMGITLFAILLYFKKLKLVFSIWHMIGIILFAGLLILYFYGYSQYNSVEEYIKGTLSQSTDRAPWNGSSFGRLFNRWIITPINALKDLLPASIMLLPLFVKKIRKELWMNKFLRYCILVFSINFLIYWISPGTRSRYLLGLYPFPIIIGIWVMYRFYWKQPYFQSILKWISWICLILILITTPFLLIIQQLPPINNLKLYITIIITLSLFAVAFFLFHHNQHLQRLAFCFILVRFVFDFVVLPIRATTGEGSIIRENAKIIHQIVKDENLWFQREELDGTVSLELVYYLEKYRQKVLQKNLHKNCSDYFLVHQEEITPTEVNVYYTYKWKQNQYHLVKFINCQ